MSTKEKEIYNIIDGPSRDKLFDSFKYAYDKGAKVPITFSICEGTTAPSGHPGAAAVLKNVKDFVILAIRHEDGSGQSFVLSGHCKASVAGSGMQNVKFNAYYNTQRRNGTIHFHY